MKMAGLPVVMVGPFVSPLSQIQSHAVRSVQDHSTRNQLEASDGRTACPTIYVPFSWGSPVISFALAEAR